MKAENKSTSSLPLAHETIKGDDNVAMNIVETETSATGSEPLSLTSTSDGVSPNSAHPPPPPNSGRSSNNNTASISTVDTTGATTDIPFLPSPSVTRSYTSSRRLQLHNSPHQQHHQQLANGTVTTGGGNITPSSSTSRIRPLTAYTNFGSPLQQHQQHGTSAGQHTLNTIGMAHLTAPPLSGTSCGSGSALNNNGIAPTATGTSGRPRSFSLSHVGTSIPTMMYHHTNNGIHPTTGGNTFNNVSNNGTTTAMGWNNSHYFAGNSSNGSISNYSSGSPRSAILLQQQHPNHPFAVRNSTDGSMFMPPPPVTAEGSSSPGSARRLLTRAEDMSPNDLGDPDLGRASTRSSGSTSIQQQKAIENASSKERQRIKLLQPSESSMSADELRAILKKERYRTLNIVMELASVKSLLVMNQFEAEVLEEGRVNTLMRRLDIVKAEKERIIIELEREEEMLTNTLQRKLSEVHREKSLLEQQIARESNSRLTSTENQQQQQQQQQQHSPDGMSCQTLSSLDGKVQQEEEDKNILCSTPTKRIKPSGTNSNKEDAGHKEHEEVNVAKRIHRQEPTTQQQRRLHEVDKRLPGHDEEENEQDDDSDNDDNDEEEVDDNHCDINMQNTTTTAPYNESVYMDLE